MQTKISWTHQQPLPEYPYLAIHKCDVDSDDPYIVLIVSEDTAIVLAVNHGHHCIGHAIHPGESYIPFNGEITLKN